MLKHARKIKIENLTEAEHIDDGSTLLSKQYHYVCPAAILIYITLQLLIGLKSGLGEPTDDVAIGTRVYYFYNASGTSFIVSAIQQIVKIFECRLRPGNHRTSESIYTAVLTVNSIAASAFLLTFIMNYGGICTDVFGVVSTTPQWAEWLVTVPLMVYMTLTIEDKPALTTRDKMILGVFVLAIAFGFLLNFRDIGQPLGIVLFVLGCCSITVNFWLDRMYGTKLERGICEEMKEGTNGDYASIARTSKQKTLSRLFLVIFPFFPATHIAGHINLLTREQVLIAYGMCSLISKLLFAGCVSDAHVGLVVGIQTLRLTTEKAMTQTRREFLRYVFHEVRVPLNTITMGLMVLKEDEPKLSVGSKEALDMMQGATNFMSDTLNDCLSLQKIEENKMEIVKKTFTMGALMKGATLAVKGSADAKNISIVIDSSLDMKVDKGSLIHNSESVLDRYYIGDQFRLEHVVMNFLSNAIKFSPEASTIKIIIRGNERREVRAVAEAGVGVAKAKLINRVAASQRVGAQDPVRSSAEVDMCDVTLVVKDQGVGISKVDQAQLFQAYSQVKADKLQRGRGSGLGLLLAKEIIMLHGGQVVLESDEGKGSSFGFCIPFETISQRVEESSRKQRAMNALEQNEHNAEVGLSGAGMTGGASAQTGEAKTGELGPSAATDGLPLRVPPGTKFLIVDDTASNRKMLAMVLKGYGVECEYAQDGQEALKKVTSSPSPRDYFDVIFMDQEMPVMNGVDSTTKIRTAGFANLIFGLTGNALDEDKHLFLAAGADCFFSKPLRQVHIDAILEHTGQHGFKSQVGKKYHARETQSRRLQLQSTTVRPPEQTATRK